MEIREIRQFSEISGTRRNPSSTEHGKFVKWNNNSSKYDYSLIGEGDIDTEYFNDFVTNIIGDTTDDYLVSIAQTQTGSANTSYWASFTMAESATKYLKLGRLAWLDTFELPSLPGDQKVLFDLNNTIGGDAKFRYNYNTNKLLFNSIPLMFLTGTEGSYKEGIKYLGNYSFSFGAGVDSTKSGSYNILSGYKAGHNLGANSARNTIYGPNAGEYASSTMTGGVFIGGYAGRYETNNNTFYLDNIDYLNTSDARDGSFLYADLATERRLYIRDRLTVVKEGKFGDSGLLSAAGEGGMFQMIDGGGGVIKPQYHDGTVWQDFAAGQNHYLQEIVEDGVTEGLWHFKVKDSTGTTTIEDLTLQLPILDDVVVPVAYTPSYPNITASDYGYIQISNTAATTNKGFYYKAGFKWDNSLGELNVPGAIKMASKGLYSASNGVIRYDSSLGHFYGRINSTWKQLDNTDFTEITGTNIGGATYEWFKQKNSDGELEFRTVQSMSINSTYNPYDRITFNYSTDGDAILIGTTAERNRLSTTVDDVTTDRMIDKANEGETLHIRALREGDNIVLTQTENYIKIDATTGGTATLMNGVNLGTYDWFAQRNGTNLEFFGLNTSDGRITLSQANGTTTFDNVIGLNLNVDGTNETIVTSKTYNANIFNTTVNGNGPTPMLYFRPILSDTISITTTANEEIILELIGTPGTITAGNEGNSSFEVFDDDASTATSFLFRRLGAVTDKHITLAYGTDDITFAVEDITFTALGSNPKFITQDGADSFIFTQKGITGSNGVSVVPGTNDIDFSIPNIEKFELSTGEFVKTITYSGISANYSTTPAGTLSFKLNHDDSINDNVSSYTARTIAEIKLGGGLKYDSVNNVLWNDTPLTANGDIDYHLNEIEDVSTSENYIFNFHVEDALGNPTTESPLALTIPKTSVPFGSYTDSLNVAGIVKVNPSYKSHHLGATATRKVLTINEVTGEVGLGVDPVTYEAQNNLKDASNSSGENSKRAQARANIGSAYVNGSLDEDFNANNLDVAATLTADSTTDTHIIGGFTVLNNQITGTSSSIWKGTTSNVTKIQQTAHNIVITIDDYATGGALYVNNTSGVTMFKFDMATGNLYIKGKLFADGDVEAFTDDTTV